MLEMIADARLIPLGFGGAELDLSGGCIAGFSGDDDTTGLLRFISTDCLGVVEDWAADFGCAVANASSASFSVTLWLISLGFLASDGSSPKLNLPPWLWSKEKPSMVGNRSESSSEPAEAPAALPDFASRAANGSPCVTFEDEPAGGCDC